MRFSSGGRRKKDGTRRYFWITDSPTSVYVGLDKYFFFGHVVIMSYATTNTVLCFSDWMNQKSGFKKQQQKTK